MIEPDAPLPRGQPGDARTVAGSEAPLERAQRHVGPYRRLFTWNDAQIVVVDVAAVGRLGTHKLAPPPAHRLTDKDVHAASRPRKATSIGGERQCARRRHRFATIARPPDLDCGPRGTALR